MKQVIDCGLPALAQPFNWAVRGGNTLYTAHGPVREDGSVHTGPIHEQAHTTFSNLRRAVNAAGGTLEDVTQVLIYLTDIANMPAVDAVYREFFAKPYPNRSSVAVSALAVPGMSIEIVAYAWLENSPLQTTK